MNQPEAKDPLDALLREQNPYVEDNGFTTRVISALPHRRSRFRLRQIFLLGATALGSVLAVLWLPWENLPVLNWSALLSPNSHVLLPWVLVLSVVGSLIGAFIAAVQWED
jgi:ABC-type multidrug transport system permease subunit